MHTSGAFPIRRRRRRSRRRPAPQGFDPGRYLWNAHNVDPEDIVWAARDPLEGLYAANYGIRNVVTLLGDITPDALETLRHFMDERGIDRLEFM